MLVTAPCANSTEPTEKGKWIIVLAQRLLRATLRALVERIGAGRNRLASELVKVDVVPNCEAFTVGGLFVAAGIDVRSIATTPLLANQAINSSRGCMNRVIVLEFLSC
jgi:hypothetical protein